MFANIFISLYKYNNKFYGDGRFLKEVYINEKHDKRNVFKIYLQFCSYLLLSDI